MTQTQSPPFSADQAARRPAAAADGSADAVALTDVHRRYGPVAALAGVDLAVPVGQIVAVLGPNGAGKSTLNEIVLGLARPDRGRVEVFGGSPTAALRDGRVGAMLQGGALLAEATARDTLTLMHGLARHPLSLSEVIERADCADFLRTRTDRLSGGQAQRLRFALAIMPDPDLLILDEPTVALDVDARRAFWRSMRDLVADGRTVLFATHYLEEADEMADRVVLLARGRVVADGTGAEVKASVGGRSIAFTHPAPVDHHLLGGLPGVITVETAGVRTVLRSTDADRCLRVLLDRLPEVRDLEVSSPRLEDAFTALTHDTTGGSR